MRKRISSMLARRRTQPDRPGLDTLDDKCSVCPRVVCKSSADVGIIVVTHDLKVAEHCQREIYLRDGKVVPSEMRKLAPVAAVGA